MPTGTRKDDTRHPAPASTARWTGTGGDNAAVTISTDTSGSKRLLFVVVAYSASPTQAGTTVVLNSGAGAAFDATMNTGTANARYNVYIPDGEVIIVDGDAVDVTAPAGGAGITASVSIYTETV